MTHQTESAAIPTTAAFAWTMFKANDRTLILDGKGAVIGGSAFPGDCAAIVNAHNADLRGALAATPALPVPGGTILTDERILLLAEDEAILHCTDERRPDNSTVISFARAIESEVAALAAVSGKGKPVGTFLRVTDAYGEVYLHMRGEYEYAGAIDLFAAPVFAAPVVPKVEKLMADMDTLRDEYASLSSALAFWLPNVPDDEGPIKERILQDVFYLGEHGPDKSAQELGWITVNVGESRAPVVPVDRNAVLEQAARLFPQPYVQYDGCDIQEAIRALKSAAPASVPQPAVPQDPKVSFIRHLVPSDELKRLVVAWHFANIMDKDHAWAAVLECVNNVQTRQHIESWNAALAAAPEVPLPAAQGEALTEPLSKPTDLSKRLRQIASEDVTPYFCTNVPKDDLRAAADEIDRVEAEIARRKRAAFIFSQCIHNMVVGNQAAWIEWQHGAGAEAAMMWIQNGLMGPGHIPRVEDGASAQAYFDANVDDRMEPTSATTAEQAVTQQEKK